MDFKDFFTNDNTIQHTFSYRSDYVTSILIKLEVLYERNVVRWP